MRNDADEYEDHDADDCDDEYDCYDDEYDDDDDVYRQHQILVYPSYPIILG